MNNFKKISNTVDNIELYNQLKAEKAEKRKQQMKSIENTYIDGRF